MHLEWIVGRMISRRREGRSHALETNGFAFCKARQLVAKHSLMPEKSLKRRQLWHELIHVFSTDISKEGTTLDLGVEDKGYNTGASIYQVLETANTLKLLHSQLLYWDGAR